MRVCGDEDPAAPISLQLGEATSAPFHWTTEPTIPPGPRALPASASQRAVSVQTVGNWAKPAQGTKDSEARIYAKLVSFTGASTSTGEAGALEQHYVHVAVIDPATREQLMSGSASNHYPPTATDSGLITVVSEPYAIDYPPSFLMQLSTDTGDVIETGPYAWAATAPPIPTPAASLQSVTLNTLTATPTGDWRVPSYCGKVQVSWTGWPRDGRWQLFRLIDAHTRQQLGVVDWPEYLERGRMPLAVCPKATSDQALVLQVVTAAGVAESAPFRWEPARITPGQVRSLQASVPEERGHVTLRWRPPANAAQAGVTSYEYRLYKGAWTSTTGTSVTVTGLQRWRWAAFGVRAVAGELRGPEVRVRARPR